MREGTAVLVALTLISAMLAIILTVGWRAFGRPPHARTWAAAFCAATLQWGINGVSYQMADTGLVSFASTNLLGVMVSLLVLIGFRQRAGRGPAVSLLVAMTGAAWVVTVLATFLSPNIGLVGAVPMLFRALTYLFAIPLVAPLDRAANPAERCTRIALAGLAAFNLVVSAFSLARAFGGEMWWEVARLTVMLGLPAAFTAIGLFAVFLLASDLGERMRTLAASDPLTGVLNRRGFEEGAARAIANARRHGQAISLVVADLDRFKPINDRYGHAAGDRAISLFASRLRATVRVEDLVARTGGEEFALLLVNSSAAGARDVAERIRRGLVLDPVALDQPLTLTASFGIAVLAPDETLDEGLRRADRALYRSKEAGRNRTTLADEPAPKPKPLVLAA